MVHRDPLKDLVIDDGDPIFYVPFSAAATKQTASEFLMECGADIMDFDIIEVQAGYPDRWKPDYSDRLFKALDRNARKVWMRLTIDGEWLQCRKDWKGAEPFWRFDLRVKP